MEPESRAANRFVRDLTLPDGVVIAMIAREHQIIPPRGSTQILAGDHLFVVLRPDVRPLVNRVFSRDFRHGEAPSTVFVLVGSTSVADLREFYGIELEAPAGWDLARLVEESLRDGPIHEGDQVPLGDIVLHVREIGEHGIEQVGLEVRIPEAAAAVEPDR